MAVQVPTHDQLRSIGDEIGLSLGNNDAGSFIDILRPFIAAYNVIDAMPDYLPEVKYPRTPGYRAARRGEPAQRLVREDDGQGRADGKLKGKTRRAQGQHLLAGVPMMNGASTLEGYVPDVDATVVTRMLDAGGTILGKAHCEYFCFSGGSHTSALGAGAQSAQARLFGRRLVVGQRGAGGGRRGRHGDRRRPGRLDPHACVVLRHLRHEADARAGAVHRRHADRDLRSITPGR